MLNRNTFRFGLLVLSFMATLCPGQGHTHGHRGHADGHDHGVDRSSQWTLWSQAFEVFVEHPYVVAGRPAIFVTHVTELSSFTPRKAGSVTYMLSRGDRRIEERNPAPQRDGIYKTELVFPEAGTWLLTLAIPTEELPHEVPLPELQVFASQDEADHAPDTPAPEGFSFFKEQQWGIPFRVEPVTAHHVEGGQRLAVPESALVYSDANAYVYVQLAGETFTRRAVHVEKRREGLAWIGRGLDAKTHVVTLGVGSLALAQASSREEHQDDVVHITDEQARRFGIVVKEALRGGVEAWIQAPGAIEIDHERMAHIVPRVKGVVGQVSADLGQRVREGQVLAVIESRELADAKAELLGAREARSLALSQFAREERLYREKVSSEQEYLSSKQALARSQTAYRAARQKLLALGLSMESVDLLSTQSEERLTDYTMLAPFDGTIIRKHIVLGEVVDDASETFVIADLGKVWVDLQVNQQDIASIKVGHPGEIFLNKDLPAIASQVIYIDPILDPATRMGVVRLKLDNAEGHFRPGTFVSGRIGIRPAEQRIVLPAAAIQMVNDRPCCFVKTSPGFALRYIRLGQRDGNRVEIIEGLQGGEWVVTQNAFHLKAEITKQAISGHGHVH